MTEISVPTEDTLHHARTEPDRAILAPGNRPLADNEAVSALLGRLCLENLKNRRL